MLVNLDGEQHREAVLACGDRLAALYELPATLERTRAATALISLLDLIDSGGPRPRVPPVVVAGKIEPAKPGRRAA